MTRAGLLFLVLAAARPAVAQDSASSRERAESLRQAGRPWHAAEVLLWAASRQAHPDTGLVVQGAAAELAARRYERARALLTGQPWLADYQDGVALAVLAEAEWRLGMPAAAALHFSMARARARGVNAALLAVRAGHAWEQIGERDSAAQAYGAARREGLATIDPWLRLRQAAVTRDTVLAFALLADLSSPASHEVPRARARALVAAGDSGLAIDAFVEARRPLEATRLALAAGDSGRAHRMLYELLARSPESDDAGAGVAVALGSLPPGTPPERVALARALKFHGAASDALMEVARAVQGGDSSSPTLALHAELLAGAGRLRDAAAVYQLLARDSLARPVALYRRARILLRLGNPQALDALSTFAEKYPADTAAPSALSLLGETWAERGDARAAARWFAKLLSRYPGDPRASQARFRLAAAALQHGHRDSAAGMYRAEVSTAGAQRLAARYWLGKVAFERGDTATARATWTALTRDDSLGYYGLRARRAAHLPPLRLRAVPEPLTPESVTVRLARIDTLVLAGLDSEAQAEVRNVLNDPPTAIDALLSWSEGLATRGWGPAAVRLGWQAAVRSPNDPRVLRAIFPWPNRAAVEAEASEFKIDPLLLVAVVRQESVFDPQALSPAGARGLAQLLPGTAAFTARGLDVLFDASWITVPDLNLHLGAAHLGELLRRFGGRLEAAVAAYNAGGSAVHRWLGHPGADDPDVFLEAIPYAETRGYVRSVLRNRELYRAMYEPPGEGD